MNVIIGGGGHAKVIVSILKSYYPNSEIGYTDIEDRGDILGAKFLGHDDVIFEMEYVDVVIGLTYLKSPLDRSLRETIINKFGEANVSFPVVKAKQAILAEDVTIGSGTVIMDGVLINTSARIGKFCVLNTKVLIEHDVEIGTNTIISPGAIVLGGAKIGNNVFLGAGVIVKDGVEICDNVVLGMGSIVNKDISTPGVYLGFNPRKFK